MSMGEFDDEIDVPTGEFSGTNAAEAFPGTLTPLWLEISMLGDCTGTEVTSRLLGLGGRFAHEAQSRRVPSFAQRIKG